MAPRPTVSPRVGSSGDADSQPKTGGRAFHRRRSLAYEQLITARARTARRAGTARPGGRVLPKTAGRCPCGREATQHGGWFAGKMRRSRASPAERRWFEPLEQPCRARARASGRGAASVARIRSVDLASPERGKQFRRLRIGDKAAFSARASSIRMMGFAPKLLDQVKTETGRSQRCNGI